MAKKYQKRNSGNGTLIKRSKTWYARWMVDGKLYTKTTGTRDRQEAELKLVELTAPFRMGSEAEALEVISMRIAGRKAEVKRYEDEKPATAIEVGWSAYLNQANRPDTGESTLHQYSFQYGAFERWIENKYPDITQLRHVTQDHAENYAVDL